jgi:multicomponent Na+:H+ antiporter subunit D
MNMPDYTIALVVAIPLLGAFLTLLVGRINDKLRNIFVIVVLALNAAIVFLLASDILTTGIKTYVFGAKDLSYPIVRILFEVDAMSIFMAIISSILVLVAVIYSWSFMKENTGLDKYYTLILLLTAGMLGMVLTGDMFNFFVFLEITSIASCALIAFWTHRGESVEAGFKYIIISAMGALFVLFAVALLYGQYNALNIALLSSLIQYTFLDKIALVLLIVALAMKAGIVPMHMWLPDSYGSAPSSISIILVSATLASLYGVFRVIFTLYGSALSKIANFGIPVNVFIGWLIVALAMISILIGVIMALIQTDFKRLIAYGAVAEIGYMFLGIGAGITALGTAYGKTALDGGIFHIMNDALDVGLLFLVAGAIYYATKETSLDKLGGLARNMKYTTVFFVIGLLAVAGMPPLNGFASKLLIYESTFQLNPILAIVAILSSILLLAVFVKVFYSAFMGPQLPKFKDVKEVPKSMLFSMGIIACIIVIFGLFPEFIINNIVEPAANALIGYSEYISQVVAGGI